MIEESGVGMNSLAICEDDGYVSEKLEEMAKCYIKSKGLHTCIQTFATGKALMREAKTFDVLLLDLQLPDINGVEVAKKFSGRTQIIFVTAYKDYALEAFEVGAVHYLLKPVAKAQLFLALDRAREQLAQTGHKKTLVIMKNGVLERILINDITYCEVYGHRLCIHTVDGCYEYLGTLDVLDGQLDGQFFRCHRSFLVNMAHTLTVDKGTAILDNGEKVLVSRRRQQEFMQALLRFLKDEVTKWER